MAKNKITVSPKAIITIAGIIAVIIAIIVAGKAIKTHNVQAEADAKTISEVTLKSVVNIGELTTEDYTCKSVAIAKDEKGEKKYAVAYSGLAKAGIDTNEIELVVDEEGKSITAIIPEAKILSLDVKSNSLEYFMVNKKYDNGSGFPESFALCKKNLKSLAKKDPDFLKRANERAKEIVQSNISSYADGYEVYVIIRGK